ncbi:MAG: MOSC domain-containing protein [Gemmatimonadales bacterium]
MSGSLLQLSTKPPTPGEHGLPKRAVPALGISATGAAGDYNHYRTRTLHGDPDQAILLITQDLLGQLNAEGWPVEPGHLGENLTLAGVPESALRPGVRVQVGDVLLEVSKACDPCTELYSLPYVGAHRGPAFLRTMAGRRGWYARVLLGGTIFLESPVSVEPEPSVRESLP